MNTHHKNAFDILPVNPGNKEMEELINKFSEMKIEDELPKTKETETQTEPDKTIPEKLVSAFLLTDSISTFISLFN